MKHSHRRFSWGKELARGVMPLLLVALGACGKAVGDGDGGDGAEGAGGSEAAAGSAASIEGAVWPSDPCTLVSVADVEAILGPLSGAPARHEGGCRYPLPPDEETTKRLEAAKKLGELAEEMARRSGETLDTAFWNRGPKEPAVIIQASLETSPMGELALGAAEKMVAGAAGLESSGEPAPPRWPGWDYGRSPITFGLAGFMGRSGELTITIMNQVISIPAEKLAELAAVVRDRFPEGPFAPAEGMHAGGTARGPDPCSLLSRSEVEKVAGPLVVAPYRTSRTSPYPHAAGETCAYRTAGHRVLRLTPVWTDGEFEMKLTRGIGGLISAVMPDASPEVADTMEGPWDQAALEADGGLVFLKGDRALHLGYKTSSVDAANAVELAKVALARLAKASLR